MTQVLHIFLGYDCVTSPAPLSARCFPVPLTRDPLFNDRTVVCKHRKQLKEHIHTHKRTFTASGLAVSREAPVISDVTYESGECMHACVWVCVQALAGCGMFA